MEKRIIKNVIFSGSGFKCWGYIGTIQAMNELVDYQSVEHVVGTSAGSLFGLYYLLGIQYDFLLDYYTHVDLAKYKDINLCNIATKHCLLEGKAFRDSIKYLITTKINENTTFQELYTKFKKMFTVCVYNIDLNQPEYFSPTTTPDKKVFDAIIASSNLPLLFPAYRIGDYDYFDGGFCNNCPSNVVKGGIIFDMCVPPNTNRSIIYKILDGLVQTVNKYYNPETDVKNKYMVLDERFNDHAMYLNQSYDDMFTLYMNGYENSFAAIVDYFKNNE